jgi:hypothetical protein
MMCLLGEFSLCFIEKHSENHLLFFSFLFFPLSSSPEDSDDHCSEGDDHDNDMEDMEDVESDEDPMPPRLLNPDHQDEPKHQGSLIPVMTTPSLGTFESLLLTPEWRAGITNLLAKLKSDGKIAEPDHDTLKAKILGNEGGQVETAFTTLMTDSFLRIFVGPSLSSLPSSPEWVTRSLALLHQLRKEGKLIKEDYETLITMVEAEEYNMQLFYENFGHSPDDYLENILIFKEA